MTDTTKICDVIKGLPDDANVEVYPPDYDSDDVLAQWKAKDLKALVAENESLKEQNDWIFGSDRIQLQIDRGDYRYSYHGNKGDSMEGLWCAFDTRNGKYLGDPQRFYPLTELIALAADGGNDDRS